MYSSVLFRSVSGSLLAMLLALWPASFAQAQSVEVWIRAFIPNPANAGGAGAYLRPRPQSKPGSMILLQPLSKSLANQCFATDHRGLSSAAGTTSRSETRLTLTLQNAIATVDPRAKPTTTAETKKFDCVTGDITGQRAGDITHDNLGAPATADGVAQVIGGATITNALVWGVPTALTPSIDYSYDIRWKPSESKLSIDLTHGLFPAIEVYARRPGKSWIAVIGRLPGASPFALMGDVWGIRTELTRATTTIP